MMINKEDAFAEYKKYKPVEVIKKVLRIFIFHVIKIIELTDDNRQSLPDLSCLFLILLMFIFVKPEAKFYRNLLKVQFMKKTISLLIIMLPSFILLFCTASVSEKNKNIKAQKTKNLENRVVVLELFTSQGCSSCPPADRLLGKYANDENVIALSFHVDYWNRLGWKDPFSSAAYSRRQKDYAGLFKLNGVYTPQLVANGEKEMVGSNATKISNTIRTASPNCSYKY